MRQTCVDERRHPDGVATIAGPLLVIAVLFPVDWLKHDELCTHARWECYALLVIL